MTTSDSLLKEVLSNKNVSGKVCIRENPIEVACHGAKEYKGTQMKFNLF